MYKDMLIEDFLLKTASSDCCPDSVCCALLSATLCAANVVKAVRICIVSENNEKIRSSLEIAKKPLDKHLAFFTDSFERLCLLVDSDSEPTAKCNLLCNLADAFGEFFSYADALGGNLAEQQRNSTLQSLSLLASNACFMLDNASAYAENDKFLLSNLKYRLSNLSKLKIKGIKRI